MSQSVYTVKTEVFEGPLDLLLELVSSRRLFVNDVSLAQVTDDFIRYIEERESTGWQIPLDQSAEFILIASTLLLIKSRSLLPTLELTQEEEESIHDLENRLVLYAKIKELSLLVKELYGKNVIFEKEPRENEIVIFSPDSKTNTSNLLEALRKVIATLPKTENLPKVTVKKVVSLEEMMSKLSERISQASRFSFRDFHGVSGEVTREKKVSIIVGFLAMLELVKRGAIRVSQEGRGEIEIESENLGTPRYF